MTKKSNWGQFLRMTLAVALLAGAVAKAEEDELFDMNRILVSGELYIWNRISDLFDLFRCGIGGGADVGVDLQITKYVQLGAIVTQERGVDFPHFIPPFWMINYFEKTTIFNTHEGYNGSLAFLCWRKEWNAPPETAVAFPRPDWDIRLEIALLAHLYVDISLPEIGDFFAGIVGYDPSKDDQTLDKSIPRRPADQFGRGLSNILFGAVELPSNILRVTDEEGDMAGVTKGVGLGLWRFFVRELVGVVEFVTFPFGWEPILEPAYPIQKTKNSVWKVSRPQFQKRY
ncbi:MAG: exosortase system-associated protein, TIGR04073 family [Victivallales bacterium]|nr:exosortase system-associated protein, TIGR04073 family [Victivallales bacterium]